MGPIHKTYKKGDVIGTFIGSTTSAGQKYFKVKDGSESVLGTLKPKSILKLFNMEFERITGFADANGGTFESANQAYKAYLKATGNEGSPEDKAKFKTLARRSKKTGKLGKNA